MKAQIYMRKQMEKKCRNCKHWDIDAARDKAGRVHKDWGAQCLWPTPPLPASNSLIHSAIFLRPMLANSGADCPCFEEREKEATAI